MRAVEVAGVYMIYTDRDGLATASSGSLGGPNTPGSASCIGPYPIRWAVSDVPENVNWPPSVAALMLLRRDTGALLIMAGIYVEFDASARHQVESSG